MNSVDTNAVLNRLLALHNRSLPLYVDEARAWTAGDEPAEREELAQIAQDHRRTVDRLGTLILENGGAVWFGEFPLSFTSLHDLAFDFLLQKLIEHQKRLIDETADCADRLATAPNAQAVAQEALGEAKGHLQSLQELAARCAETS